MSRTTPDLTSLRERTDGSPAREAAVLPTLIAVMRMSSIVREVSCDDVGQGRSLPMPNHNGVPKTSHFVLIFASRHTESMQERKRTSSVTGPYSVSSDLLF